MNRLILLPALLAMPAAASAQSVPYPQVLQFEAEGDGAWTIRCVLEDRKGKPVSRELSGEEKRAFNLEVTTGQCTYAAAPDAPLRITIGGDYACPLPAPDARKCTQVFPAGASGQLDIRRRNRP